MNAHDRLSQPLLADGAVEKGQDATRTNLYRKIGWRLLPILMVGYILSYIDRGNVSYAYLHFKADVGLTDATYGFGFGLFSLGYILFEVPSNMALQRIGARVTLLRIMALWGLISVSFAFISSPIQFYIVRILLGAAEAGFFPGLILYLSYWFPASRRGTMTSLLSVSLCLAGIIGGPISGGILSSFVDVGPFKSWQWMFILEGIPSILLGVFIYFYLDDGPKSAKWLTFEERAVVLNDLKEEHHRIPNGSLHGREVWMTLIKDYRVYFLALAYFFNPWSASVLVTWGPSIVRQSGVADTFTIGLLLMIPNIIGAISMLSVGYHSDRTGERKKHFATCMGLAAVSALLLAAYQNEPMLAIFFLSVFSIAYYGAFGVFWTIPLIFLPPAAAPVGIALISSLGQSGGLLASWALGLSKSLTGNIALGLVLVAFVELLAAALVLYVLRRKALPSRAALPRSV